MAYERWHKKNTLYLLMVLDGVGNLVNKAAFNTMDEAWDYFEEIFEPGMLTNHKAQVLTMPYYQDPQVVLGEEDADLRSKLSDMEAERQAIRDLLNT